jgi:succinate dehydrogenase / fumarate reductase, cytochrome b subunit
MAAPPPIAPPSRPRPVYHNIQLTDLARYRLPLPGIVSILHRISGTLLFLFTWLLLWLLQTSVSDAAQFRALVGNPLVKLIVFVLLWSLLHHLCAGIRYLVMDVSHGAMDLKAARQSGAIVMVVSLALTVIIGVKLW